MHRRWRGTWANRLRLHSKSWCKEKDRLTKFLSKSWPRPKLKLTKKADIFNLFWYLIVMTKIASKLELFIDWSIFRKCSLLIIEITNLWWVCSTMLWVYLLGTLPICSLEISLWSMQKMYLRMAPPLSMEIITINL